MDVALAAALEEVADEGSEGCTLPKLWSLMQSSGKGAEIIANSRSKQHLWQQLINVPGMSLLLPNSGAVPARTSVQFVDDAEKLGLHVVAPEPLRDSSLGMYDLKVCDARLSPEQRNVLEYIARSRGKGVTQSELGKVFKTPGNKMFYLVKMLEARGLVVRQATLVRTVDGNSGGNKHVPIVATNLLHLTRYAKDRTLSSHQRFEIMNSSKDTARADVGSFREVLDKDVEEPPPKEREFIIKDDLPAMQAVCQKLEETEGKVLVVSDLKCGLGYRMAVGHRTWRRDNSSERIKYFLEVHVQLVKRLQDAGLVEILSAQVEQKVRSCIRLVKSFDAKAFKTANEETENSLPLKCAKRGQVTDMVTELPIDQQIYDIVDQSGSEGVHMIEVFNSLGLQNKRNYYRISSLLECQLLVSEAENHKRSTVYRLKTAKNVNGPPRPAVHTSSEEPRVASCEESAQPPSLRHNKECLDNIVHQAPVLSEECAEITVPRAPGLNECGGLPLNEVCGGLPPQELTLSTAQRKAKGSARRALQQARMSKGKHKQVGMVQNGTSQERECQAEEDTKLVPAVVGSNAIVSTSNVDMGNNVHQAEVLVPSHPISVIQREFYVTDSHFNSNLAISTTRAQREKRMMERLQAEKFVLRVELHRWLEELESHRSVMMDRKTLTRILQGLQAGGHCKCVMLSIPGLTNCGRQRTIEVVLLPSVVVDPELLSQIHDQVRKFDMISRGHGVSRVKPKEGVPILTGVPRMHTDHVKKITKFDNQIENGSSMHANGFIPAKMVRVRMLHYFLWGYVNSLPEELGVSSGGSETSGEMVGSCKRFGLAHSVHSMPVELFLQTIGSVHRFEHLSEWCKQGLRLFDLSKENMSILLDSNATGRLSWLVDVLRRLQLVRLVMGCGPAMQMNQDDLGQSSLSAVLTYAMEREPYLEEPAPPPLPSMNLDSYDFSPRARHEFSIVNKDGLDAYWQNLEYFYTGAQPAVGRQAFPGSNVPELFGLRSWASLRIMTVEQRKELLKRIGDGGIEKRKHWHECVTIAKDLNLSLQQVLRVSYEKNRVYRLQTLQKAGQTLRKRNVTSGDLHEASHFRAHKKQRQLAGMEEEVSKSFQVGNTVVEVDQQARRDEDDGDDDEDNEGFVIAGQSMNSFNFMASVKPSRVRSRRFLWSERLDRILIASYARQRAQLGALYHRVDWDSMADLPAPPQACRRRMAHLRLDPGVRKAVASLCSLLTLRYINYSQSKAKCSSAIVVHDAAAAFVANNQVQSSLDAGPEAKNNGQEYRWDDITEPFLAAALDEVIRCNTLVKVNASTRASRSKLSKGPQQARVPVINGEPARTVDNTVRSSSNGPPEPTGIKMPSMNPHVIAAAGASFLDASAVSWDGANPPGHPSIVAGWETTVANKDTANRLSGPMPARSLPAPGPTRRVRKRILSTLKKSVGVHEMTTDQLVQNSLAVANAVEMVKLVVLNSTEAQLSGILVDAVQRFKETEIFTAVKYLRERGFLIAGHSGQPFVLSPKFFQDCSASRFPVGTGDDCLATEQWISSKLKDIEQDWVSVPSTPESGQLSHLLALVSTNEFSLTPSLPANDDLGEMEEKDTGKQKISTDEQRDCVRNVKARTLSSTVPHWPNSRKERGFPGIGVSLIRSNRSLATILDADGKGLEDTGEVCVHDSLADVHGDLYHSPATSLQQGLDIESPEVAPREDMVATETASNNLSAWPEFSYGAIARNFDLDNDVHSPAVSSRKFPRTAWTTERKSTLNDCIRHWCLESMSNSAGVSRVPGLMPELFQATHCAVQQAGEEGLILDTLASILQTNGVKYVDDKVDGVVQALEGFGLVKRVSAYDHVRIVETSQSTRFYLHILHKDGWEGEQKSCIGGFPDAAEQLSLPTTRVCTSTAGGCDADIEATGMIFKSDPKCAGNSSTEFTSHLLTGGSMTSPVVANGGDHRIIPLRPDGDLDYNTEYVTILPWLDQNGRINKSMLKGLTRRVMGLVALHPGISEDTLVEQINVLNPQSVRHLAGILELDGHLVVRSFPQPHSAAPPRLLQDLMPKKINSSKTTWLRHYYTNALAGPHL